MMEMAHMTKTHLGVPEEHRRELVAMNEETFLKNLYLFMKRRDTPIERIPHLGFKQIDLFVMFKTVRDLGGYHQVTAQQLWKQVYNSLGGNPRSTSAATCTRRHYEKLLLAYECHLKGMPMNVVSPHAVEHYRYHGYGVEDVDGPRDVKRKMMAMPLHRQNLPNLQPSPHRSIFPLPLQPAHYYHPSHPLLPTYVPISAPMMTSPRPQMAPSPKFTYPPCGPAPTERVRPLEHLRFLAEQYKSSSGLSEPLNLSIKAENQTMDKNPKSSFSPPLVSKNPKFLNTPSSLYRRLYLEAASKDGGKKLDEAATIRVMSDLAKARENSVVDLTSTSSSPEYDAALTMGTDSRTCITKRSPAEYRTQKEEEEGPAVKRLNLNNALPDSPPENDGKMEIEIPLSVFHNWLRMYGPPGPPHQAKHLPRLLQEAEQRSKDTPPGQLAFHPNGHQRRASIEDLRVPGRTVPTPGSTIQTSTVRLLPNQNHFTSYAAPSPSGSAPKPSTGPDAPQFSQPEVTSSSGSKPPPYWEAPVKDTQPLQSPGPVPHDLTVTTSRQKEGETSWRSPEMSSASLLTMNPSSAGAMLQLTREEVMKLRKIISSST
ncbi:AT-rich interaction domain 6 isoform X2 [Syngnathoides biaculeatus]|uniref:AT-rich interaction domain 6 isoform X2 n=1 Tax=Syngnathoides biaculeatus TaxID=300417 RepID=UPI002ADDFBBE|nr:AT-rich interaction domain 6 isoform X2 [Syngnathoides biaculeatus]